MTFVNHTKPKQCQTFPKTWPSRRLSGSFCMCFDHIPHLPPSGGKFEIINRITLRIVFSALYFGRGVLTRKH